jgi:hydrogenase maturation protease
MQGGNAVNEWEWQLLEVKQPMENFRIADVEVRTGSRVKLRPRAGGDIMDIALADKIAVIESIEQDYEGKVHLGVVLDEDPGRDIGLMRQPGHRFFFTAEEVEPVSPTADDILDGTLRAAAAASPRILIAGIGNIFLGDDAFGCEVVRRLVDHAWPANSNVRVTDFGIRGYDLAYALLDGYGTTILVDACPRGEPAGTLYVIEPDLSDMGASASDSPEEQQFALEAHSMNPLHVLRLAASMGPLKRVLLVGCEPATLGPEEGQMGLSATVEAAIDDAVKMVESLVNRLLVNKLIKGDESLSQGS